MQLRAVAAAFISCFLYLINHLLCAIIGIISRCGTINELHDTESALTICHIDITSIQCDIVGRHSCFCSFFDNLYRFAVFHFVLVKNYQSITSASQVDVIGIVCYTICISLWNLGVGSERSSPVPYFLTCGKIVARQSLGTSANVDVVTIDSYSVLTVVRSYAAYIDGFCWCCCKNVGT